MIPLPAGCFVTYNVWIDINQLDDDIVDWFVSVGGDTKEQTYYDYRGKPVVKKFVKYGRAKWCHHHSSGLFGTRLHFHGDDAPLASIFLLKFMDRVTQHNMQETLERYNKDNSKFISF